MPEGDEDVRRHVLRVTGRRRDAGIRPRGPQPERRVNRIVVGVNQIVRRAGMVRVIAEHRLEDRRGAHVDGEVAALVRRAEERQRVERGGVRIVRIRRDGVRHRVGVGEVARLLVAVAVEDLDGAHIVLFPRRLRLRRRAPRASAPASRALCARRRGPAPSRRDGCRSSPRPSRPSRSRDRSAAPGGRDRRRRRTRSCEAGRDRRGNSPARRARRNSRTTPNRGRVAGRASAPTTTGPRQPVRPPFASAHYNAGAPNIVR